MLTLSPAPRAVCWMMPDSGTSLVPVPDQLGWLATGPPSPSACSPTMREEGREKGKKKEGEGERRVEKETQ